MIRQNPATIIPPHQETTKLVANTKTDLLKNIKYNNTRRRKYNNILSDKQEAINSFMGNFPHINKYKDKYKNELISIEKEAHREKNKDKYKNELISIEKEAHREKNTDINTEINKDEIVKNFIQDTFKTAFSSIKRENWDSEKIDKQFAKRSISEIISSESPNVCFMNSCFEFCMIAIEALKKSGINSKLILVRQKSSFYNTTQISLHFGIEFTYENEKYFVDNMSRNNLLVGKGDFTSNDSRNEFLRKFTFNGNAIDRDKKPFDIVGARNTHEFESFINQKETDPNNMFRFSVQLDRLKSFAESEKYNEIYTDNFLADEYVKTGKVNLTRKE